MSVTIAKTTEDGEADVDVVVTCHGMWTALAILRGGGLVGYRSDTSRPPPEVPVEFVDWPFQDDEFSADDWEQHLAAVRREEPKLAVAPDITEDLPLVDALEYANELAKVAETVIMVPKAVEPSAVPDFFRVGVPCQERYGGLPHPLKKYKDVSGVHLLGGSPSDHAEYARYYIPIRSLDTSTIVSSAKWGSVWKDGKYRDIGHGMYPSLTDSVAGLNDYFNDTPNRGFSLDSTPEPMKPDLNAGSDPVEEPDVATTRGPHPCQRPDCGDPTTAASGYTHCEGHA